MKVDKLILINGKQNKTMMLTDCFKCCAVLEGEAIWQIGNVHHKVSKGDIILLGAGDRRIYREIGKPRMALLAVSIEPQQLIDTPFLPLFTNRPTGFSHIIKGSASEAEIIEKIVEEDNTRGMDYEMAVTSLLFLLLVKIKRHYIEMGLSFKASNLNPKMNEVLEYIGNNFDSNISLGDVAKIMHMSESAFSKYFSKHIGIGFSKFVNQKRVDKAIYLLQTTDQTVLSIAISCGFNNTISFYKTFRKITGCTPSVYRTL